MATPKPDHDLDQLLAEVEAQLSQKPTPPKPPEVDPLAAFAAEFAQKKAQPPIDPAAQLRAQEEELRAQRGRELERQQRRRAIAPKAEAWLKGLDPYSEEGLWFEQFADNYASRLEAAIDYLDALR